MAEQQPNKKDIAVDLECDDEFEEFGNEGAKAPCSLLGSFQQTTRMSLFFFFIYLATEPTLKNLHLHLLLLLLRADWGQEEEDAEDVNQWEEDWDDSDQNDEFTRQLRAQLERHA